MYKLQFFTFIYIYTVYLTCSKRLTDSQLSLPRSLSLSLSLSLLSFRQVEASNDARLHIMNKNEKKLEVVVVVSALDDM